MKRLAALALLFTTLAACRSTCCAPHEAPLQHVVLVWLNEPGDAAARQRLLDVARELAAIPEVLHVSAGEPLPSEREVVDDSFDVGFVMRFASPEALAAYDVHPDHARAVREVLEPLAARVVVYDLIDRAAR